MVIFSKCAGLTIIKGRIVDLSQLMADFDESKLIYTNIGYFY